MATPHKFADILHAIANGEQVERLIPQESRWVVSDPEVTLRLIGSHNGTIPKQHFRVKAKQYTLAQKQLDVPELKPLPFGTKYYIPDLKQKGSVKTCIWSDESENYCDLKANLVYLFSESAADASEKIVEAIAEGISAVTGTPK